MNIVTLKCFYNFLDTVKNLKREIRNSAQDQVRKLRFSSIVHLTSKKQIVLVMSRLSDSTQV